MAAAEARSGARPPNILYIHSHDTGRCIQPYGYAAPTPNLMRLAEEGVLFRNAFSGAPTCSPSRAALLTGQCAHSSGMLGLAHRGFALSDYGRHLVSTLKAKGYLTALAGVQHEARSWEQIGYDRYLAAPSEAHAAAASFLRNPPAEPFFLAVGFHETHRVYPELENPEEARFVAPPAPLPDLPEVRVDMARYLRSARILDEKIGEVLSALRSGGAWENTLIIATTDHGVAFPRMKCNLTDDGIGVYLIMHGPNGISGGRVIDALVSQIDLFPTVCEVTGIDKPEWLEGVSLLPLIDGTQAEVRDRLFAEVTYHAAYEPMRCVRTGRYKYIVRYDGRSRPVLPNVDDGESKSALLSIGWFPIEEEQLYDLLFDPHETRNIARDPAQRAVLAELRESLLEWMIRTRDPLLAGGAAVPRAPVVVDAPRGAKINDADGLSPNDPPLVIEG